VETVVALLKDLEASKELRSRFCTRLLPVTDVCFASMEQIEAMAARLIPAAFPSGQSPGPLGCQPAGDVSLLVRHVPRM
jgi:hypothetical protein